MKTNEIIARQLCKFDGADPDTSLGGDKQNWAWMEYMIQADGLIDAGMVIVPKEPTDAMIDKGKRHCIGHEYKDVHAVACWRNMLAAYEKQK